MLLNLEKLKIGLYMKKFPVGKTIIVVISLLAITYKWHILICSILGLRFDIVNAPNHRIFDDHKNCSQYFCDKKSSIQPANNFTIKNREISREIETVVSRLSNNAKSLLLDVDNNSCEQFNSVINKFLGGKRINFTQKSSYSTRVYAAVISFNSSQYLRTVKKNITQISPGIILLLI